MQKISQQRTESLPNGGFFIKGIIGSENDEQ